MQSSSNGNYPPFIEEIQREMRVTFDKGNHIILMGYSLPPGDIIYRNILAAKRSQKDVTKCSVVVGKVRKASDTWLEGEEFTECIQQNKEEDFSIQ